MSNILFASLCVYIPLVIFCTLIDASVSSAEGVDWLTVGGIYGETNMNLPSCIIIFIILSIFTPILTFLRFLNWITHVGRKN